MIDYLIIADKERKNSSTLTQETLCKPAEGHQAMTHGKEMIRKIKTRVGPDDQAMKSKSS